MSDPHEIGFSVSNWHGTRSASSDIKETLGEAQSLANEVIGNVNYVLNQMEASGDHALAAASDAIHALGAFTPSTIAVNYSPPGIQNPGYLMPGPFTLNNPVDGGGGDGSFSSMGPGGGSGQVGIDIYNPGSPIVGGTPPVAGTIDFGTAPALQTFYAPPPPREDQVKSIGEPPPMVFTPFSATLPSPPTLRELVLPEFTPQPFPEYTTTALQPLPTPPVVDVSLDELISYVRLWDPSTVSKLPRLGGVLVRDLITERDVRNAVETWRIRGWQLDEDLALAQIDYADEKTRLMNQAESRQLIIDEGLTGAESERLALKFLVQYEVMFIELAISVAKIYFEAITANAEAQLSLAKAMTSYYNALLAEYSADAELYKLGIEEEVAKMKYWEALVQAEVAKTKANEQMSKLYVETEQVETIEADVYQAQVGALMAQVERYKAQIEALVAKSEVARNSVAVYRGTTEAYAAGVAAYKAGFDSYAAKARSVSAQNQAAQATAELSLADATRTATEATVISTNFEIASEQLRAQANFIASQYEPAKLHNAVQAMLAQIQASSGRIEALRYSSDKEVSLIPNEAASAYANQAGRYYSAASESAYRASEQTLKAITSATQAAAIAQEAAGRSSAALSQGAYSAVHVSAGLRGSGRLDGQESHTARIQSHFSDMLTYSESKNTTISA